MVWWSTCRTPSSIAAVGHSRPVSPHPQLGRVDEVELVNKEMYSSRVREFSVRGRQSHPRKDGPQAEWPRWFNTDTSWQLLGSFTAANLKGGQSFKLAATQRVRYVVGV